MHQVSFGVVEDNGEIRQDAEVCAVCGLEIEPGDARISINAKLFYRVKAQVFHQWTDAQRAEVEGRIKAAYAAQNKTESRAVSAKKEE